MINLIPYGEANFEKIRKNNLLYIDKTMFIEKLEQGSEREKCIYLRPRSFGKSLFTNMLTTYYSLDMKDKFEDLFKGLYIYDNPTENRNNYYVLNFNFSGLTILDNNIIQNGITAFTSSVKASLISFINKYNLNISITRNTPSDLLLNILVQFAGLQLKNKIYIIIDEYS